MSNSTDEDRKSKKQKKKSKKRHKHQRRSSSLSSSSSSASNVKRKKHKKKSKKESKSKLKRSIEKAIGPVSATAEAPVAELLPNSNPISGHPDQRYQDGNTSSTIDSPAVKPKGPMTKEQWEKQKNTLKRVVDPISGRTRLIRGDGEILEEIVSRERHIAINKAATRGDGAYYETVLGLKKHK